MLQVLIEDGHDVLEDTKMERRCEHLSLSSPLVTITGLEVKKEL